MNIIITKTHNKYKKNYLSTKHLLKYGTYGLKLHGFFRFTIDKISILEFLIKKKLKIISKKKTKVWSLLVFNNHLTKLNSESRMGKGKGIYLTKSVYIKPGSIIFEFDNIEEDKIIFLFKFIKKKIAVKCSLIGV